MDLERTAFALRHLYVYPRLGVAYTYIPKNACTSFKRTLGKAQGRFDDDTPSAHTMRMSWWLRGLAAYPRSEERIAVVRDPWDRLLSGYLNRFLMHTDVVADHAWKHGLSDRLGPGRTRGDVTFADFVEFLAATPNHRLNEHWRPQTDFMIGSYTRLVRFEHIAEDTTFLAGHGLQLEAARGHATSVSRRDLGPGWGHRTARRLRRLRRRRGVLPTRENLYDAHLHALVAERYADDVALFERVNASSAG
ncbi:MAG TPA: sulfotransferase family 2 domain-containing protein [Nocardioidaceae bacterium]